jgi:hypothetical protein
MKRRSAHRNVVKAPTRRIDAALVRRILLGATLLAPLALGGAHPAADAAIWALVLVALVLHVAVARREPDARHVPFTSLALLGVAGFALVRTTPVGRLFASESVSEAWRLWPDLAPRGLLAPDATAGSLLRLVGLAAAIHLGSALFSARPERQKLAAAVIAGTSLAALIGLAQWISGADRVLFVYEPLQVGRALNALSGPFVNPNQAGALAALGALFATISAWRDENPARQIGLATAAVALGIWCVALDAGAAAVALFSGVAVLSIGAITSKLGYENRGVNLAVALGVVLSVGLPALALFYDAPLAASLFSPTQLAKATTWREGLQLIVQAPLFGHGIGSWSDLAPAVLNELASTRRAYPESAFLQFVVEHGLLASLVLVTAIVADLGPWLVLRSGIQATPWRIAAAALFTSIAVEFALGLGHQAGAIVLIVALSFGMAVGTARSQRLLARRERPEAVAAWRPLAFASALILLAIPALAGLRASVDYTLHPPESAAAALVGQPLRAAAESLPHLAERAPASAAVVAIGTAVAASLGQTQLAEQRMAWLLEHAPDYSGTWGAALDLAQRRDDPAGICTALAELLERGDYDARFELVSNDVAEWVACMPRAHDAQSRVFGRLLRDGRALDVLLLSGAILVDEPANPAALEAAATSALRAQMYSGARHYAAELRREHPGLAAGWLLGADAAARDDDAEAALALLDDAVDRLGPLATVLIARADHIVTAAEAGNRPDGWRERVRADLEACTAEAIARPAMQRSHALIRARAALADGDAQRAAAILDSQLQRNGNDVFAARLRARAAVALDDTREASVWWRRLLELAPGDAEAIRMLNDAQE